MHRGIVLFKMKRNGEEEETPPSSLHPTPHSSHDDGQWNQERKEMNEGSEGGASIYDTNISLIPATKHSLQVNTQKTLSTAFLSCNVAVDFSQFSILHFSISSSSCAEHQLFRRSYPSLSPFVAVAHQSSIFSLIKVNTDLGRRIQNTNGRGQTSVKGIFLKCIETGCNLCISIEVVDVLNCFFVSQRLVELM